MTALFKAAFEKRIPLREHTNALRLVNGRGDGLDGLILEEYNGHFVAQAFESRWVAQAELIAEIVRTHFKPQCLLLKDRSTTASSAADDITSRFLIKGASQTTVQEYGLSFAVDVHDGLNAGLFLDMRANRRMAGAVCKDKKVLNCFSYTCSFGVHARANGAAEVLNVDLSRNYLKRGQDNYALNKFAPGRGEFLCFDAVEFLEKAVKKANCFDVIIIDPPSFARGDKKTFQVKRDLPALLDNAVKVITPGGHILVSTNFNGIAHTDLKGMLKHAADSRPIKDMAPIGQDKDFPGTNTFKESYLAGVWASF